jgi:hypothetical protein
LSIQTHKLLIEWLIVFNDINYNRNGTILNIEIRLVFYNNEMQKIPWKKGMKARLFKNATKSF